MSIGVLVFPGSNCDRDVKWATEGCLGMPTRRIWHEETDLSGLDAVVLPGGFSYGDYLRCGAIARFAPALQALLGFVAQGGRVLGICNGFQVLTELGLLRRILVILLGHQLLLFRIRHPRAGEDPVNSML